MTTVLQQKELESAFSLLCYVYVTGVDECQNSFLRWLERPARRSLRESQIGVRFPWKLRFIPIAWPRDRHVEDHWHRWWRLQNLWKVWALEVLTGRSWLPALERCFSVIYFTLSLRHGLHMQSRNGELNFRLQGRRSASLASPTKYSFEMGWQRELSILRSSGKSGVKPGV